MNDAIEWLNSQLAQLDVLPIDNSTPEAKLAYDIIKREIPQKDFWFKKLWNINLPDAKNGYSVLTYANEKFYLDSYSLF